MRLAMAVQADHLIGHKLLVRGSVRLDSVESRCAGVTIQAVLVVESYPRPDRFVVGTGCVASQMPEAGHLGLEVPAQTIVAVTVIALILGDPSVLVVARRQRPALRI